MNDVHTTLFEWCRAHPGTEYALGQREAIGDTGSVVIWVRVLVPVPGGKPLPVEDAHVITSGDVRVWGSERTKNLLYLLSRMAGRVLDRADAILAERNKEK